MLPATTFQFIIAMIVYAINERTARRIDYLQEEVRVLKEALATATGKKRIDFTAEQRRRLALKGEALTSEERSTCCQIVRPATILAWFRQLAAQKYDSSKWRRPGRPRKEVDIQELVVALARENPGWGYTKIRDALRGLKIEIGRTTVADMLAAAGIEPAPERNRKRTWKQFLKSHWDTLYACDFFSVEVLGVFGSAAMGFRTRRSFQVFAYLASALRSARKSTDGSAQRRFPNFRIRRPSTQKAHATYGYPLREDRSSCSSAMTQPDHESSTNPADSSSPFSRTLNSENVIRHRMTFDQLDIVLGA